MNKITRILTSVKSGTGSGGNGSPQQQRKSESESDFRSSKNRSSGSGGQAAKRPSSSDMNNNDDDKRGRTQTFNTSSGSTDRAKALDDGSDLENHLAKEEVWSSSESNGSATDDDIGDVWDEEEEEEVEANSFGTDEVDGFSEHDDDEAYPELTADDHRAPMVEGVVTNVQQEPAVFAGPCLNIWNLEDIPEEEAAELLAVVTAAEEYLSSVASGGGAKRLRSISNSSNGGGRARSKKPAPHRPPTQGGGGQENAEEIIIHHLPTVAPNSSYQRKQKHLETGGANTVPNDDQATDNKSSTKTRSTTAAHLTSAKPAAPAHSSHQAHSAIEPADSREEISNISMDSVSSSRNRSYRGTASNAPQLHIFSVGETKFPESPTSSRRDTLSNASQSSRASGRSLRSGHQAANGPRVPGDRAIAHFKVTKCIKAIHQLDSNEHPSTKFRVSPPPPILDFRPGTPPNDQSPPENDAELPSPKRQALDSACLSKLATDIERLLAQLDNELPEEKIRYSTVIRDRERLEDAEVTLDKKDFRKCYCNVLSINTIGPTPSPLFLSPCSDGGDATFYSGDDGEASLIMDTSIHMAVSWGEGDEDERYQSAEYIVAPKERVESLTFSTPEPKAPSTLTPEPRWGSVDSGRRSPLSPSPSRYLPSPSSKSDGAVGYRFTPSSDKDGGTRFRYTSYASASTRLPALARTYVSPRLSPSATRIPTPSDEDTTRTSSVEDPEEVQKKFTVMLTADPDPLGPLPLRSHIQDKIRELEKLLSQERELRIAAERSEQIARKRLEQVEWKLDQAEKTAATRVSHMTLGLRTSGLRNPETAAFSFQADMDSKREQELSRLRSEAERARREHQLSLESLRKKQVEVIACIEDQLNAARSERTKAERECSKLRAQLQEAETNVDALTQDKV